MVVVDPVLKCLVHCSCIYTPARGRLRRVLDVLICGAQNGDEQVSAWKLVDMRPIPIPTSFRFPTLWRAEDEREPEGKTRRTLRLQKVEREVLGGGHILPFQTRTSPSVFKHRSRLENSTHLSPLCSHFRGAVPSPTWLTPPPTSHVKHP